MIINEKIRNGKNKIPTSSLGSGLARHLLQRIQKGFFKNNWPDKGEEGISQIGPLQ